MKFYAADPCRLVEEITRYQFFLQVKQDVLQGRLPVTQDLAVELAALSLQCKYFLIKTNREDGHIQRAQNSDLTNKQTDYFVDIFTPYSKIQSV